MSLVTLLLATALADDAKAPDPAFEVGLGKGVIVRGDGASFQVRARVQERVTFDLPDGADPKLALQVRRARVSFTGKLPQQNLQL